jgi:hypothetical protein
MKMKRQVDNQSYTLELVPHPKGTMVEAEKRRADVLLLLKQMQLRAKKKGRPANEKGTLDHAA